MLQGVLLIGQETSSPLIPIVNAGVLGALAVCFILGLVVSSKTLEREAGRADRAEERQQALQSVMLEQVVPLLERATTAMQASDSARQAEANKDADLRVLLVQVRDELARGNRR